MFKFLLSFLLWAKSITFYFQFLSIFSRRFPNVQWTWTGHKDAADKITALGPISQGQTQPLTSSPYPSRLFTKIIFTSDGKLYWFQENLNTTVRHVNNQINTKQC